MGYGWKRARCSLKLFLNQALFDAQKNEIEQLIKLNVQRYINLYFGDESHFGLTPNVSYAWQDKQNPILLPSRKSQKLSIFGIMNLKCQLFCKVVVGGFNSSLIIPCIDEFAKTIEKR